MMREHENCPSCICGKRAPVQGGDHGIPNGAPGYGAGTISWAEHELAYATYARDHGRDQSAQRIADRGGFGYAELVEYLGRPPETWAPRGAVAERERFER